jgi:transglutaminase-like putative cysteine protease
VPSGVVLAVVPVLAITVAWLRLEQPPEGGDGLAIAVLALTPALVSGFRRRLLVAAAATLVALWVGAAAAPDRHFVGDGLRRFYEVGLPFDPTEHPEMHALTLLALFGFGLAVTLAATSGRVLLAAAIVVGGAGWPATLVDGRSPLAVGALILAAALWLLVLSRPRARRWELPSVIVAAAVVVLAATASTSSALSRDAIVDWQSWDLYDPPGLPLAVRYIWDANYTGIEFPEEPTTMLRVKAPRRALYWRASTLDTFDSHRWIEHLFPVQAPAAPGRLSDPVLDWPQPGGRLPPDPLLPPAARTRSSWVRQDVQIAALRDDHVLASASPVSLTSPSIERVFFLTDGVVRVPNGLRAGDTYTAWSYVPQPTARELTGSKPRYPADANRFLHVGRARMPVFRAPGRTAAIERMFADDRYLPISAYRGVWRIANRLAGNRSSPYRATIAIERWLRSHGGFRYEEQPPQPESLPPLADFVTRTKAGYCQHFAGAMTLMLRFLGIPARVAVGFTSGRWADGVWTVTDHDAHAWVEAWFRGYGWLTFDPTPGRGTLSATYTVASDSAEAAALLNAGRIPDIAGLERDPDATVAPLPVPDDSSPNPWRILGPLLALAAAAVGLGALKLARRRGRYLTRDPRRIAAATRAELVEFLRDQRLELDPDATFAEVQAVLEQGVGVSGSAYATAAGRARYGPPAAAAAAARDARRELKSLLRVVRARLSPRLRLRGYFATRSLRGL